MVRMMAIMVQTHLALVPLQSNTPYTHGEPSSPARVNRVYKIDCDFSNSV